MMVMGVAHARILHVGDNTIKLSQTKTTTPALHVRVGDEVWYGAMCTNNQKNTLHVKFNNIVYDVIEPFTDTTNYTCDESGRLIGANENIYLESTGTQKINTYVLPSLTLVTNIGVTMNMNTGFIVFGIMDIAKDIETYRLFNYLGKIYFDINGWQSRLIGTNDSFMQNKYYEFETGNFYVKNLISGEEFSKKKLERLSFIPEAKHSIWIFGDNQYPEPYASGKIYFLKIWDNDVLIRHFVPVPCGLKIGDFVVPSNGMWDIVEQKFYGNMGTGEFIYGVD